MPFEIRYIAPKAEEVYLLWGLNGWNPPDKSYWPPGAAVAKRLPYCKMTKTDDEFSIVLSIPAGSRLDYCFNVLIPSSKTSTWDANGGAGKDYHSVVKQDGMVVIIPQETQMARLAKPLPARSPIDLPWIWILPIGVFVLTLAIGLIWRSK